MDNFYSFMEEVCANYDSCTECPAHRSWDWCDWEEYDKMEQYDTINRIKNRGSSHDIELLYKFHLMGIEME